VADAKIPKKYWWVAVVAVPIVLALIAIVPQLRKSPGGSGGGTTITGGTNTIIYGTNNTFITNVSVFAREYELQTGRPLSDELRKQIGDAVAAAQQNNHAESVRLFEQVAKAARELACDLQQPGYRMRKPRTPTRRNGVPAVEGKTG
jgi:hypothetical protein